MSQPMSRVSQADVARVLRAAKKVGVFGELRVRPDGTIEFQMQEGKVNGTANISVVKKREIVL